PPYWQLFPYVLAKFTFSDQGLKIISLSLITVVLAVLLFGSLFFLGVVTLLKRHGVEKTSFLLSWLCVPILLLVALDIVGKTNSWMISRYLIAASPAYYIILSSSIALIRNRYLRTALVTSTLIFFSLALISFYKEPKLQQWKEAIQYIDQKA